MASEIPRYRAGDVQFPVLCDSQGNIAGVSLRGQNWALGDNVRAHVTSSGIMGVGCSASANGILNQCVDSIITAIGGIVVQHQYSSNRSYRVTSGTIAAASPQTATATQIRLGLIKVSPAGAFTLNTPSGTDLDAQTELADNPYVGKTIECFVIPTDGTGNLTIGAGAGVTVYGGAAKGAGIPRRLVFFRTAANTYDCMAF